MSATLSPLATVLWGVVHALRTRAAGPPGRAPWWHRAPPAQSARLGVAAAGETPCADPAHRLPSPSHGALAHPTRRAFPGTAPAVCDTAPRRHMALLASWLVACPLLRQGQAEVEHGVVVAGGVAHTHTHPGGVEPPPLAPPLSLLPHPPPTARWATA